jgi:YD repeat-containing protein
VTSGNPMIADVEDSTEWYTGIGIAESVADLVQGIESGNWVDIALGGLTTGLEALSIAMDPIGSMASNLVSFVIEHVGPLQDALDALAGDADAVAAQSKTWKNIASTVGREHTAYIQEAVADTASWTGRAGDAYRTRAVDTAALMSAAATAASGLGSAIEMAGVVVGVVRETVRDLIADLVGRLTVWAAEALTIIGAPAAAAQAATAAAKWAARIAQVIKQLVRTLQNLMPLLRRLGDLFKQIRKKLDDFRGKGPDQDGKDGKDRYESDPAEAGRDRLIDEVQQNGHAIDPDKVVHIGRDRHGRIVWLEEGNESAGLGHMLTDKRVAEFAAAGVRREDIGETAFRAVTEGRPIGITGRDRVVYEVQYNGETKRIAVTVGSNGFIVGANPVGNKKIKPLPGADGEGG